MRRQEKIIEEVAEINDIMAKADIIHVAMISDGEPYVVPMSFGFRDGVIYLHCAREGRKIAALRADARVCFEVCCDTEIIRKDKACNWTYHFRSVIGRGRVTFVSDYAEKLEGLSVIMEHYGSSEHSFGEKSVEATEVLRVDIEEMTGKKSPVKKNIE